MPIQVICPGCHARFKVSDKFAGKTGPCPKCKQPIKVPEKSEQITIDEQDDAPVGKGGVAAGSLKPIKAKPTKFNPMVLFGTVVGTIFVFGIALLIGWGRDVQTDPVPSLILWVGAVLLAPPLAFGGYFFLRDHELEPYHGVTLWIRVGICAVVYAALWGIFAFLRPLWFGNPAEYPLELWHFFFVVPGLLCTGAIAAFACFDLDYTSAVVHYGFYLGVTILLRLAMSMPALG